MRGWSAASVPPTPSTAAACISKSTYVDGGTASFTYTFHGSRLYFKIDQVLYRGDMIATSCHRDRAGSSDHYPLVTTFVWKN